MIEPVLTENAPKPIGPYSQAVKSGGFLFCSGQLSIDPKTNQMNAGDVATQAKLALTNLKGVVEAGGSSLAKVVRCTIFLKDMSDFPKVNDVYATFFKGTPPSRSTVEVSRLPKDALVEIDCIAAYS